MHTKPVLITASSPSCSPPSSFLHIHSLACHSLPCSSFSPSAPSLPCPRCWRRDPCPGAHEEPQPRSCPGDHTPSLAWILPARRALLQVPSEVQKPPGSPWELVGLLTALNFLFGSLSPVSSSAGWGWGCPIGVVKAVVWGRFLGGHLPWVPPRGRAAPGAAES